VRKWLAPVFILLTVAFTASVYSRLPARMPVHWGVGGNVNRYGSRAEGALLMPFLMIGLWLLLRFLPHIDLRRANYATFADTYDLIANSLIGLFAVMHVAFVGSALGWPISVDRVVPALVGVQFLILGNALPRARPNWWFGIRTPWTLSSDRVWMRTHRVAGYLLAAAGILLLTAAALPSAWTFTLGVAAIGVAVFGAFIYSYVVWKEETSK
jgi:immunity protein, SdpI family